MYKSILVPVDLGEENAWKKAVATSEALAQVFDAELHVVSVVPDFGRSIVGSYFPKGFEGDALKSAGDALKAFIAKNLHSELKVKGHIAHGTIYEEINKAADKLGCDLIILASHRPELKDYLLQPGSSAMQNSPFWWCVTEQYAVNFDLRPDASRKGEASVSF